MAINGGSQVQNLSNVPQSYHIIIIIIIIYLVILCHVKRHFWMTMMKFKITMVQNIVLMKYLTIFY
jgi:hypothetical protein